MVKRQIIKTEDVELSMNRSLIVNRILNCIKCGFISSNPVIDVGPGVRNTVFPYIQESCKRGNLQEFARLTPALVFHVVTDKVRALHSLVSKEGDGLCL